MRASSSSMRRQYLAVTVLFTLLLLTTFALFAHLITRQLSRAYIEDILLSGQAQAEELARQMDGEGSLYKVIERRREALAKLSVALSQQQVIESVHVYDNRGKLVWHTTTTTEGFIGGFPQGDLELLAPPAVAPEVRETSNEYDIQVPIGDLGSVVFSHSRPAIEERVALLRRRLIAQTAIAAGLAVAVLGGAVAFIWHLVQRNATLERRRRLDEELASLGSLAANLAHEIRNPLNALSLNLELLEEDLSGRGASDTVGLARREVGRLSRLVTDFLVYARPATPAAEETDAALILEEVARLLRPACERAGVALRVDVCRTPLRVDRGQLCQVLVNLALNAVQAMEHGDRRELGVGCRVEGGEVVLEVKDSGPGIPESELGRVREAFVSLRKGGTGLGLAIADRIVQAHGGRLELSNLAAGGLLARVVLPGVPVEQES